MRTKMLQADFFLLFTALIWGGTFVIVKQTLEVVHPLQVIAYRFTLAFLFLFTFFYRKTVRRWKKDLLPGIVLGTLLACGFLTQTYGLQYTTPSTSAFITGLNVVMVAIFESALFKKRLPLHANLGVIAATAGLFILTWSGSLQLKAGDLLTFFCAVFFALHIVTTGRIVANCDPGTLTVVQFGTVAVVSWVLVIASKMSDFYLPSQTWPALIYLGILATGLAFLFQTSAQRLTTPVHTAIILSLEPAFAAVIAFILGMEHFTLRLISGGVLILVGMIMTSTEESPKELQGKMI